MGASRIEQWRLHGTACSNHKQKTVWKRRQWFDWIWVGRNSSLSRNVSLLLVSIIVRVLMELWNTVAVFGLYLFPGQGTALVGCVLGDMKKTHDFVNTPLHVEIRLLSSIFISFTDFKLLCCPRLSVWVSCLPVSRIGNRLIPWIRWL